MMQFSTGTILSIALIMTATFFCSAIIFPEDTTDYTGNYDDFGGFSGRDYPMSKWLDLNFDLAYQHIINGVQISNREIYSARTYMYMKMHYDSSMLGWDKSHQGIFDTYDYTTEGAGMRWYQSNWVRTNPSWSIEVLSGTTKAKIIDEEYHLYMQKIGAEAKPQGNIIDTIVLLLTNVWNGVTQFARILTFTNIPNMPLWVTGILNVFFLPMWIVMVITFTPYVTDIIRALASFIQAVLPW